MKKQYLFCCALLLSVPYAQYACAMDLHPRNEPVLQEAQAVQCAICLRAMENPRRLSCGHEFCNTCVGQWALVFDGADGIQCPRCENYVDLVPSQEEVRLFNQVVSSLGQQAQSVLPRQAVNQAQSEQRAQAEAEQHRALTPAEQTVINQIADNLESFPNFVQCLHDVSLLEQFLQQAQEAPAMQAAHQVQPVPAAQQVAHVEHEQRQQLTDRQLQILQALIQDLENINNDSVKVMLIDAYHNPLVLANSDFMAVLTDEQRAVAQEFIALSLDAQVAQQQPAQNMQAAQQEQHRLTQIEHDLIAQLAQELARLERDDIDAVLIEAYTNPYALVQNPVFVHVLNEQQKEFVDTLLEMYTQRISQQNN